MSDDEDGAADIGDLIRARATERQPARTKTYSQLADAEPFKWFRGARGGVFRVVKHRVGGEDLYTRVYWKPTPDQPERPMDATPVTKHFVFHDHKLERR